MKVVHEHDVKGTNVDIVYLRFPNCEYAIIQNDNGLLEISKITDEENHIQIVPISTNKFRVQ